MCASLSGGAGLCCCSGSNSNTARVESRSGVDMEWGGTMADDDLGARGLGGFDGLKWQG